MTKEELDLLKKKISQLKRNEEQLGKDVLRKNYSRSYGRLKKEIAELLTKAVTEVLWTGVDVLRGPESDIFIARAKELIGNSKYKKKAIRDAVFERYCIDDALNAAAEISEKIHRTIYADYLIAVTVRDQNGLYNPVLGMYWDSVNKRWFTPLCDSFRYFPVMPEFTGAA